MPSGSSTVGLAEQQLNIQFTQYHLHFVNLDALLLLQLSPLSAQATSSPKANFQP